MAYLHDLFEQLPQDMVLRNHQTNEKRTVAEWIQNTLNNPGFEMARNTRKYECLIAMPHLAYCFSKLSSRQT